MNTLGENIGPMFSTAAAEAGLPLWFVLGCAHAESGLNPRAERWGAETAAAKTAMAAQNWAALDAIIRRAGADISFGYGQQIILYHYLGDRTATRANILAVREAVFNDQRSNVQDMCKRLVANVQRARNDPGLWRADGDPYLGALIIYNAGSLRTDQAWWNQWAGNVASYKRSIAWAKSVVGA